MLQDKPTSINVTGVSYHVELSYLMDDSFISALKKGNKLAAMRIKGSTFSIDVSDFENQLQEKFNECWID
jgi:hypothetical protein